MDQDLARRDQEVPPGATSAVPWDENMDAVLEQWRNRAWAAQTAHYRSASRLRRRHVWLGVPVVILSTVVGTSLFATLNEDQLALSLRIAVGSVSVAAAVLSAVQTFFAFAQRADQHTLAADWYAAIRRRIELVLSMPPAARGDARKTLDGLRKEFNTVGSQFPQIGDREWTRAASRFGVAEPPPTAEGRRSAPS